MTQPPPVPCQHQNALVVHKRDEEQRHVHSGLLCWCKPKAQCATCDVPLKRVKGLFIQHVVPIWSIYEEAEETTLEIVH